MHEPIVSTIGHPSFHILAIAGGGSAFEIFVLGLVILASSVAYIIWLVKRKL